MCFQLMPAPFVSSQNIPPCSQFLNWPAALLWVTMRQEPNCYGRSTSTAAQASEPRRCTGCVVGYMGTGCELPCTHGAQAPMDSGFCQCLPCFTGGGCQTECTGHGHCVGGTCSCAETWRGAYCEVQSCPGSPVDCSGHGECNAALQLCVCEGGWSGAGCTLPDCGGQPDCSGRGTCNGVLYDPPICVNCVMSMGPACELPCVHGVETPAFSGICACESCYSGAGCNIECSGNGACTAGSCVCNAGWGGQKCDLPACPGET